MSKDLTISFPLFCVGPSDLSLILLEADGKHLRYVFVESIGKPSPEQGLTENTH